jgi:hypothetical protein
MDVGTQFSQYPPGGGRGAMRCGHNCKLRKSLRVSNVARRLHLSRQNHGVTSRMRGVSESLRRFWLMLAYYHAQIWNGAELARSFGVGEHTVCRYRDVLAGTFLVRQLPPSSCLNPRCAHMPRSIGYGTCWRAIILIASWPGGPKWLKYSSATWTPTS